ncbi:hypothetical protein ACTXT7_013125 [Hymenolepis weldensis]
MAQIIMSKHGAHFRITMSTYTMSHLRPHRPCPGRQNRGDINEMASFHEDMANL